MSPSDLGPIRLHRLPHGEGLEAPSRATPGSAGYDLRAGIEVPVVLEPGEWTAVPTGLTLEIPLGWEGQVRPRSGLAFRYGVTVLNAPGTIDSDYRGEVKVLLINHGKNPFTIERGDRIAQLLLSPTAEIRWIEGAEQEGTHRGSGGFGSTGR